MDIPTITNSSKTISNIIDNENNINKITAEVYIYINIYIYIIFLVITVAKLIWTKPLEP